MREGGCTVARAKLVAPESKSTPHMMNVAKWSAALVCVMVLQGCCVFGFRTEHTMEWVNQGAAQSALGALHACTLQAENACAQTTLSHCQRFVLAPQSVPAYHHNSGRRLTHEDAINRELEGCQKLLAMPSPPESMHCPGITDAIERCMVDKGFVEVSQPRLACASLKVF